MSEDGSREKLERQGRRLRGTGGDRPPQIFRWRVRRCHYQQCLENVIANCHRARALVKEIEKEKIIILFRDY